MAETTIASRYTKLQSKRGPYINRAVACASVTIPSLFQDQGETGGIGFITPNQSLGARAVNTLSAKIVTALLPANQPFFRMTVDDSDLSGAEEGTLGEVEKVLSAIERLVMSRIESKQPRPVINEITKQLIVAGNVLLYRNKDEYKAYRLDKYVCKRNASGKPIEVITEELITDEDVPRHMKHAIAAVAESDSQRIKLNTQIKRNGNHWVLNQEINGVLDPKARSTYTDSNVPYVPLRMIRVDGEDYGRSYVEEYLGDLKSYESLAKSINEGTAAAARLLFLVSPNGVTKPKSLVSAPNGGFVTGKADDVVTLQIGKQADFNTARMRMGEIKDDIGAAFLMNGSITRDAERVTAAELRIMAQELELVLGGVYSLLSVELQLRLIEGELSYLTKEGKIPDLPEDALKPKILTGVAALGRTQELDKLRALVDSVQIFGPEVLSESMEVPEYIKRVAAALSVDTDGLFPTEAQREERKNAKEMERMAAMAPQLQQMNQGGNPGGSQ